MNRAILIGRLTKDPELRSTNNGVAVCTFTLAVDRRFKDSNGEKQADFIPVVCWRTVAENVGKYMSKGRRVGVCGSIQVRTYDANDGSRRYITEIVADEVEFLDSGDKDNRQPQPAEEHNSDIDYGGDLPF